MALVAGVDFGTQSVRVSIFDSAKGRLAIGTAPIPLRRKKSDPDYATQSHSDHLDALVDATRAAIASAKIDGKEIEAIAIDTTGSSVIPVGQSLEPLDDYYLWCDHRAWSEAALITRTARQTGLEALKWCGGTYSTEWGFSKLLHWLRHNPAKRNHFATALEHCDMITAVLCGINDAKNVKRSVCAMGHKWMWSKNLGGLPPDEFLESVDPLFKGVRPKLAGGSFETSDAIAGQLSATWAERLGLRAGIPLPVGALDAHWDAVGSGIRLGDVVNVIGTSTCIMAITKTTNLTPGVCGVVPGSIDPGCTGIEAGLSATGDIFEAIARRAQVTVQVLSERLQDYQPGQTALLRLVWDNGDRTVLVNPELGGVTFGWNLMHAPEDELFAAIEGTAFHTRIILERMEEYGTPVSRVINTGGIPRRSAVLNQVYANILDKPILVPEGDVTGLGSAIFAFLAAGTFETIAQAQEALCPSYRSFEPQPFSRSVCEELFGQYRRLYFAFGDQDSEAINIGSVLPTLRRIASTSRSQSVGSSIN